MRLDIVVLDGGPRVAPLLERLDVRPWQMLLRDGSSCLAIWDNLWSDFLGDENGARGARVLVRDAVDARELEMVGGTRWRIEADPRPHRGTAGVVRDLRDTGSIGVDADWIAVVEASASPAVELGGLVDLLVREESSVVLGASELDRFCGVLLLRPAVLDLVPEVGFCDLKEQLIPVAREEGSRLDSVVIAERALRVNELSGALASVAALAGGEEASNAAGSTAPRVLAHGPSAISESATCAGASIISSIVFEDAFIESGAIVARSIVGPGAIVSSGMVLSDSVLSSSDRGQRELAARLSTTSGAVDA